MMVLGVSGVRAQDTAAGRRIEIRQELKVFDADMEVKLRSGEVTVVETGQDMGLFRTTAATPSTGVKDLVDKVNRLREAYFIGLSDAQKEGFVLSAKKFQIKQSGKIIMRLASCDSAFRKLLPDLLTAFMTGAGFEEVRRSMEDGVLVISGKQVGDVMDQAIKVASLSNQNCYEGLLNGHHALLDGKIDACITSVAPGERMNARFGDKADFKLPSYATLIGRTAIVVTSAKSGESLSLEEIHSSLTKSDRFQALKGEWSEPELSELLKSWFEKTVDKPKFALHDRRDSLLSAVKSGAQAPGLLGWTTLEETGEGMPAKSVFPLGIRGTARSEPVWPSVVSVRTEEYPLVQSIRLNVTEDRSPMVKALQRFIRAEASPIIRKCGLIPMAASDSGDQPKWLSDAEDRIKRYQRPVDDGGLPSYAALIRGCERSATPFVLKFGSGNADINLYSQMNPEALPNIRNLVSHLAVSGWFGKEIVLIGHTDKQTGSRTNKALGNERVRAMKTELQAMGVPVQTLTSAEGSPDDGMRALYGNSAGALMPVSDIDEHNRRVELWLKSKSAPAIRKPRK